MVNERQGREGESRNPQQTAEKSDAPVVPPCKKSMNSRVTPEESMEGRGAADGKSTPRNTRRAQNREIVTTKLEWIGQHAARRKGERFNNLLNHIEVPLRAMASFRHQLQQAWHRQLQRRSQRAGWTLQWRRRFEVRFSLPSPRIVHPWPEARFAGP